MSISTTPKFGTSPFLDRTDPPDIDREAATPLMSLAISPSPQPELAAETWLEIFRIATFIPHETDISATTITPGLFCTFRNYQAQAFEAVLPLRRAIVQVSRCFYQLGAEVLYTSFHASAGYISGPDRRLLLFSELLVSRPELGQFVKRLSLQWSEEDKETNYRIINRCPDVIIFSSFLPPDYLGCEPWWGQGLPKTIRTFDAIVNYVPITDILAVLGGLPHLEMLHFWGLEGYSIPHAPICLSALRILSIYQSPSHSNIESYLLLLPAKQLPRLIALATNIANIHARLSFPLDVWRRLEYFKIDNWSPFRFFPDYFHSLRRLHLTGVIEVELSLKDFPFHQLEYLALDLKAVTLEDMDEWKRRIELVVALPLDPKIMPSLKLFQLNWGSSSIYDSYRWYLHTTECRNHLIQYFESLVTRFEERGVLLVERQEEEVYPGFQPIRDILTECKSIAC